MEDADKIRALLVIGKRTTGFLPEEKKRLSSIRQYQEKEEEPLWNQQVIAVKIIDVNYNLPTHGHRLNNLLGCLKISQK